MRTSSLALALLAVVGCSKKADDTKSGANGSGGGEKPKVTEATPQVKKPVDTKPLPELAADPGGATGKAIHGTGFGGLGIDAPRALAVADGEAYVAGYFDGEIDFGGSIGKRTAPPGDDPKKKPSDAYVAKIGKDGKVAWVQTFGAKRDDVANGIAIKGDHVVVVGNFLDEVKFGEFTKKSAGSDDAFVAAFSRSGEIKWAWSFGGIDSDGANTVAATPDGGWVVGGSFMRTADFGTVQLTSRGATDAMLIKLGPGGDLEWVKQFGGAYQDSISDVTVDGQGNIIVQGVFRDVSDWGGKDKLTAAGGADYDVVLAKYDLNGDHVWSKRYGNAFDDFAGGVTVDPAGNITMVGSFDQSVSFGEGDAHKSAGESDIFVARFTPNGALAWARTFGADRADIADAIASDAAGNTIVTGWFENTVEFGKTSLTSKGNKDVFALKLDANGGVVWAHRFGDKDHDQGRAVAVDEGGAAYVAGIYRFTLDAVTPALTSTREENDRIPKPDTFVLKLDR